mgnify:CR=1 FL=1
MYTANIQEAGANRFMGIMLRMANAEAKIITVSECIPNGPYSRVCEDLGYSWYGKGRAGIAIRKDMDRFVRAMEQGDEGRSVFLNLKHKGIDLGIASVYLKPGLDNGSKCIDSDNIIEDVCKWANELDSVLVGGDLNQTGDQKDRYRIGEFKGSAKASGKHLRMLEGAGFRDAYLEAKPGGSDWTHSQNTQKGKTFSRIDYIFARDKGMLKTYKHKIWAIEGSTHRCLGVLLGGAFQWEDVEDELASFDMIRSKHATKDQKEEFATNLAADVKGNWPRWEILLQGSDEDVGIAIEDLTRTTLEQAKRVFPHGGGRKGDLDVREDRKANVTKKKALLFLIRQIAELETSTNPLYARGEKWIQALRRVGGRIRSSFPSLGCISPDWNEWKAKVTARLEEVKALIDGKNTNFDSSERKKCDANFEQFADRILNRRKKNEIGSLENEDGEMCCDKASIMDTLEKYMANIISRSPEKPEAAPEWIQAEMICAEVPEYRYAGVTKPFKDKEVLAALGGLSDMVAPGPDGCSGSLYKMAVLYGDEREFMIMVITRFCQAIFDHGGRLSGGKVSITKCLWKKAGKKTCDNLRPIALQNSIFKLPSKILPKGWQLSSRRTWSWTRPKKHSSLEGRPRTRSGLSLTCMRMPDMRIRIFS